MLYNIYIFENKSVEMAVNFNSIKNSISRAFNKAMEKNSFFQFMKGVKRIDTTPYDRDEIVQAYSKGGELSIMINKYMSAFSAVPTKLINIKSGEEVTENWRLDLMNKPWQFTNRSQYDRNFILQYALFNEVFIKKGDARIGLNAGQIQTLQNIQGQYVDFVIENDLVKKIINSRYNNKEFNIDDFMVMRGEVVDPEETLHALSNVVKASYILKKLESAHESERNAFLNDGANYLISKKNELDQFDQTQAKNLEESVNDKTKKGQVRFTSLMADVHDISRSPVDLGILESSKDARKVLAMVFEIPLPLIDDSASTYDNYRQALKDFFLNTIIPIKEAYCELHNDGLNCAKDGLKFVVDYDKIKQIQREQKDVQETLNFARASLRQRWEAAGLKVPENAGSDWDEPIMGVSDSVGIAPDMYLSGE